MNNNMEKVSNNPLSESIAEALLKLKKEPQREGVDLLDITKKLSSKKFEKRGTRK